jgi:hypothetical protein
MFLDEVTGAFRSRLIPALEDLEVCPGSSSLDGGERLCAKIGLFQSRRSVFGQASISARKPIAGEFESCAQPQAAVLARHGHRRSPRPEHRYLAISKSANRAAGLRRIVCAPVARCPRTVL